jgi:large subunit ribosomal protein L1
MVKTAKRMKKAYQGIEKREGCSLQESISTIKKFPQVKFDETVELHFQLNIDTKSSDQLVRGTVVLPHGTGKKIRIAVFCKGEQALKAKNLGVEIVGAEDLIEKVSNGFLDFDCIIATPEIMKDLSKLGRVLGPRGLMPSPKAGTVAVDVEKAIKEVQAGRVEFKSDKQGGIHVGIGKLSFSVDQIMANAKKVIDSVQQAKPVAVKVELVKTLFISTTMGPGLKVTL